MFSFKTQFLTSLKRLVTLPTPKPINLPSLNNYLKEAKIQLKNKNNLEEFKIQYPNLNIFINRAFAMYNNKVLQNGY